MGLLRAAVEDPNPVLVLEHKLLYKQKGEVPAGHYVPLGKADVRRRGSDLTIVATAVMVGKALAAAEGGDGDPLLALNDQYLSRGPDGYSGTTEAQVSVVCLDRQWPRETAPYVALAERVAASAPRFGPAIALSGLVCADWPVPPVGRAERVTAPGSAPVLVVGTTRDPATPYAWSVALAGQLARGVLLTYDGDGHTVYRTGAPACVWPSLSDHGSSTTGVSPVGVGSSSGSPRLIGAAVAGSGVGSGTGSGSSSGDAVGSTRGCTGSAGSMTGSGGFGGTTMPGTTPMRPATLAVSTRCAPEVSTSRGSPSASKTRELAICPTVTPSESAAAAAVCGRLTDVRRLVGA